jgi:hypothetical protein
VVFLLEKDCCHKSHEKKKTVAENSRSSLSAVRPLEREKVEAISGFVWLPTDFAKPKHITRRK